MSRLTLEVFADKVLETLPLIIKESTRRVSSHFYKIRVTFPQIAIMSFLSLHEECKMTDIARSMNVSTAAMTGIVDRLVKFGYVRRDPDTKDRRIIKVKLTPKGRSLLAKINAEKRKMIINLFGRISQRERELYIKILTHIKSHIK